jgi:hypothetical protein
MTIIIILAIILAVINRLVNRNTDEQKQLSGWKKIIAFLSIERALKAIRRRD